MNEHFNFLLAQSGDALLYFLAGLLLAFVSISLFPQSIRRKVGDGYLILFFGIVAVFIGYIFFPLDPGYSSERALWSAFAGAVGGGVGGLLGAVVDKLFKRGASRKRGTALPIIFGAIGFFMAQLIDAGSSKLVSNSIKPSGTFKGKNPIEVTYSQYRHSMLSDASMGTKLSTIEKNYPAETERYLRFNLEILRSGWRKGYRGNELDQYISTQAAIASDKAVPFIDDEALEILLQTRVNMINKMYARRKSLCLGTITQLGLTYPIELKADLFQNNLEALVRITGAKKQRQQPMLNDAQFEVVSNAIFERLYEVHGDSLGVFLGEVKLTKANASTYCTIELDFMKMIRQLPGGLRGPREEYFRKLTKVLLDNS